MNPTVEQRAAIDAALEMKSLKVEAKAGTGKTATLCMIAQAMPSGRRGQYLVFNKAMAEEIQARIPASVAAKTFHALAYAQKGREFRSRLNMRLGGGEVASMLGLKNWQVSKALTMTGSAQGYAILDAIRRFTHSMDAVLLDHHFGGLDIKGLGADENREISSKLTPYAQRLWALMSDPKSKRPDGAGEVPASHDVYLKLWADSRPVIQADYIMMDECQPPGTMVMTPTGSVPIESIKAGDTVVGYNQHALRLNMTGNLVLGTSVRHHSGQMVKINAGDLVSHYTPNHICVVRIADAFEGKSLLYLMRRGNQYRVGVTRANHGRRIWAGVRSRLAEEKGNDCWILDAFDSRADALLAERSVVADYGIPDVTFIPSRADAGIAHFTRERLDAWWANRGDMTNKAILLLKQYGRDIRYPIASTGGKYMLVARATEVRAANLFPGMRVLDAAAYRAQGSRGKAAECWLPIKHVTRDDYDGLVYSLDVDVVHTYVADGIVTHNCQDMDPLMLAVLRNQPAPVFFVGDPFQQLYSFRGAVDAMSKVDTANRTELNMSFRFGSAVADEANKVLRWLGCQSPVIGFDQVESVVGPVDNPAAILCRTNAAVVRHLMDRLNSGQRIAATGVDQARQFFEAAGKLKSGIKVGGPLQLFTSWHDVVEYSETPEGSDLAPYIRLEKDYGVDAILSALATVKDAGRGADGADIVISTAHRSKGQQYESVVLDKDFRTPTKNKDDKQPTQEEMRLLYVAMTRAKRKLDISALDMSELDMDSQCNDAAAPVAAPVSVLPTNTDAPEPQPEMPFAERLAVCERSCTAKITLDGQPAILLSAAAPRATLSQVSGGRRLSMPWQDVVDRLAAGEQEFLS